MNKSKITAILGLSALLLISCGQAEESAGIDNIAGKGIETGYQNSYTQGITGQLHNKGMGWNALEEQTELGKCDLGKNGTIPECDNIGIQTSWALIEKTPGEFDWSLIDKTIDYWTSLGKRINFRICTDSLSLPEVYFGAPSWINEAPYNVGYEEYQYSGDMMARVNDLTDPTYQQLFENFMDKLADRYVNNPYLDTVDIRGYGMYGEWHSGHSFQTMEEREKTLKYIVEEYQERFAKNGIELWVSCSWDYQGQNKDGSTAATWGNTTLEDYMKISALDEAYKLPSVGFRRDGLAGSGCTKYVSDERAILDAFRSGKQVSFCAEYYSGIANYISGTLGVSPLEATDELLFKSHCNYSTALGWVNTEVINILDGYYGDYAEVFDRGNTKMGYRFKVDKTTFPKGVKQGNTAHVLTSISNSAVGRFTLSDYNIRLMLINEAGKVAQVFDNKDYDLRVITNGSPLNVYSDIKIDSGLADGTYTLAIAIVDKNGNPSIRFAQVGNYDDKVYPLGKISVGNYEQLNELAETFDYSDTNSHTFKSNKHYELTFEYTPSVKLEDYVFGDDNGFIVRLVNGETYENICTFQDVSELKAMKTVSFSTDHVNGGHIEIIGTGIYRNKINVGKMIVTDQTGFMTRVDKGYDLLSYSSTWFSDSEYTDISTGIEGDGINDDVAVVVNAQSPHTENVVLSTDSNLLTIKPNTTYTISFDTKGAYVGGDGAYYFIKVKGNGVDDLTVAEWYDRPDEPQSNKTYTFTTGNGTDYAIVFGVKNVGGYYIDNINLVENCEGNYITGTDHPIERNVRPSDNERTSLGYVETFENGVLNDCQFTYGFNRWGCLTNDTDEVIEGNFSMSSRVEPETYKAFKDNNWFEFMYSNTKYVKLKANTSYKIRFTYKIMDRIVLNTDPDTYGDCYLLVRSQSGADYDQGEYRFAKYDISLNTNKTVQTTIKTGNADDYRFIFGVYGRGVVIIDKISINEVQN